LEVQCVIRERQTEHGERRVGRGVRHVVERRDRKGRGGPADQETHGTITPRPASNRGETNRARTPDGAQRRAAVRKLHAAKTGRQECHCRRSSHLLNPQIRALVFAPFPWPNEKPRRSDHRRLPPPRGASAREARPKCTAPQHPERGGRVRSQVLRSRLASDPTAVKALPGGRQGTARGWCTRESSAPTTYGEADGLYYLALEWAEGKSLAEYVHRAGPLAPTVVVSIVRQPRRCASQPRTRRASSTAT